MSCAALDLLLHRLSATGASEPDEEAIEREYPGARRGAVLVLFYPVAGQPHLVLTQRTTTLSLHSGQISLPGGRIDPDDPTPREAALRETREELGLTTDQLAVWGPLQPVFTVVSNFILLPFVGLAEARPSFVPSPAEVAEIIELPLSHLLLPSTVQNEIWRLRDERRRVGFYRFGEYRIWGATARVLRQIVALAGGPPPPAHLVTPGEVEPEPEVSLSERRR